MDEAADGNRIILTDEEGDEYEFEIIDVLDVNGERYAILGLLDDDEEAVVLRIELDEEGEEYLVYIEDDDEWERVAQAWQDEAEATDEADAESKPETTGA